MKRAIFHRHAQHTYTSPLVHEKVNAKVLDEEIDIMLALFISFLLEVRSSMRLLHLDRTFKLCP